MADPLAPDAITALVQELLAVHVTLPGARVIHRVADTLAALSAQVKRLQVLNDQVAAMGVTDCERADAAEAEIVTLTAQLHEVSRDRQDILYLYTGVQDVLSGRPAKFNAPTFITLVLFWFFLFGFIIRKC